MSEGITQEQIIARAMKDPAFRQELLSNPKEVLAREYNIHLPEEMTVRVLEEPPKTLTLVLPGVEEEALELTDAELESVSGGGLNYIGTLDPHCYVTKVTVCSTLPLICRRLA